MTWRHIAGVAFCIAALLVCGMGTTCHDLMPSLKDVVLVAIGGIIGDANSVTKYRSRHRAAEQRSDGG